MFRIRFAMLLTAAFVVACSGGGPGATSTPATATPGTATPTTGQTATGQPSSAPSDAPASLDPAQSDAGVIGQVTVSNDADRGGRDGTYTVIGLAGDGSDCSPTLEGDEFIAVAWHDDAPIGQIHQFGISVAAADVPAAGTASGVDGRVSFDFVSESGIGTLYIAAPPDDGEVAIDIVREGDVLRFDFEGATKAGTAVAGTMLCSEAA